MLEADAALIEESAIGIVGVDDSEARAIELEMPFDERQCAAPDRAEADHHDRTGDARVNGPLRHGWKLRAGGKRARLETGVSDKVKTKPPRREHVNATPATAFLREYGDDYEI